MANSYKYYDVRNLTGLNIYQVNNRAQTIYHDYFTKKMLFPAIMWYNEICIIFLLHPVRREPDWPQAAEPPHGGICHEI